MGCVNRFFKIFKRGQSEHTRLANNETEEMDLLHQGISKKHHKTKKTHDAGKQVNSEEDEQQYICKLC